MTRSNLLAVLVALVCVSVCTGLVAAADLLADRHSTRGLGCASCHGTTGPQTAVTAATCIACHGAYTAIAEKTARLDPNPHASHRGELACGECHHAHQPSVDFCAQCHDFGFKVR